MVQSRMAAQGTNEGHLLHTFAKDWHSMDRQIAHVRTTLLSMWDILISPDILGCIH